MSKKNDLKNSLIWLIRWLIYIPLILLVISLLKTLTINILGNLVWWLALIIWSVGAIGPGICFGSVFATGLICPNPKFGNLFFLGLFLVTELFSFYAEFGISTALENILRFFSDFYIVGGFILASFSKSYESESN
tara:strand:- start:55 stop:459 length:405 start_codon:yes stop_codon:yes gene_type:complete